MNRKNTPAQLQGTASGSSFYAGMRVLPKPEREAMYAIYAFCRAVDDIADDQAGDRATRAAQLDAWRADIASLYAGGPPAGRRWWRTRCAASVLPVPISTR